jgi:hypothetical protein
MSTLYAQAACPWSWSLTHVHFACSFCIPMLHVYTACPYGMSMLYVHVSVLRVHAVHTSMSMLHILATYSHNFRKTAGTKMEISPLKYMIETYGFFHYTQICSSNISERRSFKIFNGFVDM